MSTKPNRGFFQLYGKPKRANSPKKAEQTKYIKKKAADSLFNFLQLIDWSALSQIDLLFETHTKRGKRIDIDVCCAA